MRHVAAFLTGLKETFSDDATGKLSWQALLGVYLLYILGQYVQRTAALSDVAFVALVALQALFIYGPTANLSAYFKALALGVRSPAGLPEPLPTAETPITDSPLTPATDINARFPNPTAAH